MDYAFTITAVVVRLVQRTTSPNDVRMLKRIGFLVNAEEAGNKIAGAVKSVRECTRKGDACARARRLHVTRKCAGARDIFYPLFCALHGRAFRIKPALMTRARRANLVPAGER